MANSTKHDAVYSWLKPEIDTLVSKPWLFNHEAESRDSASFEPVGNDRIVKKYVRGAEKEYRFNVVLIKSYSTYADEVNQAAINFCEQLMDWIQTQQKQRHWPDMPEGCTVKKVELIQNMPVLAGTNPEEKLARYEVSARVLYYEED